MEKPLPEKNFKWLILSAWLLLWPSWVSAQQIQQDTQWYVEGALSGMCLPDTTDLSRLSESYTIKSWDTFSGIAASRGINYWDFILYLREFNPWLDINTTLRVWDEFFILSRDVTQQQIDTYKHQIEQRQRFQLAETLWNEWKTSELNSLIWFDITPSLPINLWLRRIHEVTADMRSQWYDRTARSALPRIEHEAVCKNTLTQYESTTLWFNNTWIVQEYDDILTREWGAWMFPWYLEDSWIFTRRQELDLRSYFNRNFWKWWDAIPDRFEQVYSQWLLRMLEYFRWPDATGCFIPTLFHYTSYAAIARQESGWRDINSHIFSCKWISTSEDLESNRYDFLENLDWDIRPSLAEITRSFWWKYFENLSDSQILWALEEIHEYIWIEVKSESWEYSRLEFDGNLSISNISNIDLDDISAFRIWGRILSDGLQITPDWDNALIEHRLLFDWTIAAAHHLNIFHFTSVLEASPDLLDAQVDWIAGRYAWQVDILRFYDITRQEIASWNWGPSYMYLNELSREVFSRPYNQLDAPEKLELDELYRDYSLWLQMLWYHTFLWTDWTPGSTNVNAPIPLLKIFTPDQIQNIRWIYSDYINERRQEYNERIEAICDNHESYSFMYFRYFPGDTSTNIWNTLVRYVDSHDSLLAESMSSLLPTQRLPLISEIFWDVIASWNIPAGDYLFLDVQETLETMRASISMDYSWTDYLSRLSREDRQLVSLQTTNVQVAQSLAYFLIKEWYVPDRFYQYNDSSFNDILENFLSRLKRKDRKRFYTWLHENGVLESNQNFISWMEQLIETGSTWNEDIDTALNAVWIDLESQLVVDTLQQIIEYASMIPAHGPNSFWDLQMRFKNLTDTNFAFERWPTSWDLRRAINVVLSPPDWYDEILSQYARDFPVEYERDIHSLRLIQQELDKVETSSETVYNLLTGILRLNDTGNQYLIGKIISLSLGETLHRENIDIICEQLRRVWDSCSELSNSQLQDIYTYSHLIMNKWPAAALSIITENYLLRVFTSLHDVYPDIPIPEVVIQQDTGISTNSRLNYFELRDRIESYIEHYESAWLDNTQVNMIITALRNFIESSVWRSQKHYNLLSDASLQSILSRAWSNSFAIPSQEEIWANSEYFRWALEKFFAYNNDRLIENFIPEPEAKANDFLAPFLLFMLYGQSALAAAWWAFTVAWKSVWAVSKVTFKLTYQISKTSLKALAAALKWRYKQFKKDIEQGKKARRKNKLLRAVKRWRQKYFTERFVLSNRPNNTFMADKYQDGEYIIDPQRGIFEKRWDDGLVLSSDENNHFAYKAYKNNESKNIKITSDWVISEIEKTDVQPSDLEDTEKKIPQQRISKIAAE